MRPDKLEMMANQIGTFFSAQGHGAPRAIADHIRKFWDPVMRKELLALRERDSCRLSSDVIAALDILETS